MSQETSPTVQDALQQVDQDLRQIVSLLTESEQLPDNAGSLEELKRLAAQAHDVLQAAVRKAEGT